MNDRDHNRAAFVGYDVMSRALAELGQSGFADGEPIFTALCSILQPYTSQPSDESLELLAYRLSGASSCLKVHIQLALELQQDSIFNRSTH